VPMHGVEVVGSGGSAGPSMERDVRGHRTPACRRRHERAHAREFRQPRAGFALHPEPFQPESLSALNPHVMNDPVERRRSGAILGPWSKVSRILGDGCCSPLSDARISDYAGWSSSSIQ